MQETAEIPVAVHPDTQVDNSISAPKIVHTERQRLQRDTRNVLYRRIFVAIKYDQVVAMSPESSDLPTFNVSSQAIRVLKNDAGAGFILRS